MSDGNSHQKQSAHTTSQTHRKQDDHDVDAEHDPHRARKVSNALLRKHAASSGKQPVATPQKQPNPTYTDARMYAETLFRRQGEMVTMLAGAARDGLTAFSLRSSEAYNHVDSIGLALFEVALSALPVGSAFAAAFKEMKSAKNSLALIGKLKSISEQAEKIHHGFEKVEPIIKGVEEVKAVGHNIHEIAEKHEIHTETQEKAEFQIETLSSLRELTESGTASRWAREDSITAIMQLVEFSDPSIDLRKIVSDALGPMPAPGDLAALKPVATAFEMKLYESYYLDSGKVSRHVVNVDGAERVEWEGLPEAVIERFKETGNWDVLDSHPKVKRTHRNQFASPYMGHRF